MSMIWRLGAEGWESLAVEQFSDPQGSVALVRLPERRVGLLARARDGVRINGRTLVGGFQLLEHQDELLQGDARYCFSAHALPQVQPFHAAKTSTRCPICRGEMRAGDPAVRCPGCQRWFHQRSAGADGQAARQCWTYAESCRFCGHPTELTAEKLWRPEQETLYA